MNFDALFNRNSYLPRLTPILCLWCAVVYIGLALSGGNNMTWAQAAKWGYYPTSAIWDGNFWSLITSTFVHFEIWHIAFNVYWLWILGNILEDSIGTWLYLLFFIGAAWVSSSCQLLLSGDTGIGMSGVGYALFGFGWIARRKYPTFSLILNQQTIVTFLIWLVGCAVATQLGLVSIANAAHLGGLLFGVAVAAVFAERRHLVLSIPGLVALTAVSFVPLFWCPLSSDWTWNQAYKASQKGDYATAIYWYQRSLSRGQDPDIVWHNLALIYLKQGNAKEYAHAVEELRKVDKKDAADFGAPDDSNSSDSSGK